MYLDMGNMKSYNKSHGCEQPYVTCTLIPSPLSVSYIYLLNTERSSSGVRINDLAISLRCATFLKILVCHDKGEKFSGQTGPRDIETMKVITSTSSPPQSL